jgi:Delta7-sterol 5-desaturase
MNTFLSVWPIVLGIDFARYAVTAGLMVLFLFVLRQRLAGRRLHATDPGSAQRRAEIAASLRTVVVFSLFGFGIYLARTTGLMHEYAEIADFGWAYFLCSVLLAIVAQDAWFYWTHRAMHHPRLFRFFHRRHHRSVQPTPWAAYSFDVPEAMVQAAFLPLFLLLVPMHDAAIFLFVTHMIVRNVMGHCGYELFPRWLACSRLWGWSNTVTHHDLHHESFRSNYGLYFTWWDRLMGTEHPDYRRRLAGPAIAATLLVLALPSAALADEPPRGEWATPGFAAKVRIEPCGERLCGRITWLWDPASAARAPIGTEILRGLVHTGAGEWSGSIYNPEDGRTYEATMKLGAHGELQLRGCALAIFCSNQVWRRASDLCSRKASQAMASAAAASHGSRSRFSACQPARSRSAPAASEDARPTT